MKLEDRISSILLTISPKLFYNESTKMFDAYHSPHRYRFLFTSQFHRRSKQRGQFNRISIIQNSVSCRKRKLYRPTAKQKRKEGLFTRHVTSGNIRVWNRDVCTKS